jgi:hypothetical protein
MNKILNKNLLALTLMIFFTKIFGQNIFAPSSDAAIKYAQSTPYKIISYATHEIDSKTRIKTAIYRYKFENNSKEVVSQITIGEAPFENNKHDDYFLGYQGFDEFGKKFPKPVTIYSPSNWSYELQKVDESNQYVVQWSIIDFNNPNIYGVLSTKNKEGFAIRSSKADKKFTSTYVQGSMEYKPALIESFDKIPPSIAISLTSTSPLNRIGWLEVNVATNVLDAYDPYPVALLTKITSNQTIASSDIDAVFNEETRKFWVKKAPNRNYTIEYTGMDASGNKTVTTSTIWAAQ